MNPEQTQAVIAGVGIAAGVPFVTWLWLKKTTRALDLVPLLQRDNEQLAKALEEVAKAVKAAHARLDAHVRETHDRFDLQMQRLVRIETRWETHDREQDRKDGDIAARLERVETKIDALPADVSPRLARLEDKLDNLAESLHAALPNGSGFRPAGA